MQSSSDFGGGDAMRIYLTGFMGCGKSTVGACLAELLGWAFVDLDREIVARTGQSVAQIFAQRGEREFRRLEKAVLQGTFGQDSMVVATGGGTIAQPGALDLMRGKGKVVWLELSFDDLLARLTEEESEMRPLWGTVEEARALYRRRLTFYRRADLHLLLAADDDPQAVAERIIERLAVER